MYRSTRAVFAATVIAAFFVSHVSAQDADGREDVLAAAPDDIGVEDIGRLFTRDFRPLVGGTNSVLPRPGQGLRAPRPLGTTDRVLRVVETEWELRANARVWGLGGASLGAGAENRHAYFRAIALETLHEIDPRLAVPSVPEGAEWYVSAVYVNGIPGSSRRTCSLDEHPAGCGSQERRRFER